MFVLYRLWIIGSERRTGRGYPGCQDTKKASDQKSRKHSLHFKSIPTAVSVLMVAGTGAGSLISGQTSPLIPASISETEILKTPEDDTMSYKRHLFSPSVFPDFKTLITRGLFIVRLYAF